MADKMPFIPELHDIGKLVDRQAMEIVGMKVPGHTYHRFSFPDGITPPSSPSWWGQWSDDIESLHATSGLPGNINDEGKACIVLTKIADIVASCISRPWVERKRKGSLAEGVRLLWHPDFYDKMAKQGKRGAAFRTPAELWQMFAFIDHCRGPEEFFERFSDNLRLTPEDKSAPLNFIPMGTHLRLTGKVFRVLYYWTKVVRDKYKPYLEYDGRKVASVTEAAGGRAGQDQTSNWVFRLVKCRVRFPQTLARLRDLNVLRLRQEMIEEIVKEQNRNGDIERQPYAVLFHTGDFLCMFLPGESLLPLRQAVQPLLAEGFWLECEELEAELNLITSTGARTRHQLISKYKDRATARKKRRFELRHLALWPELTTTVAPPLCDLCQLRQGEEYIKDQVREWLCPNCRKIRELGEPAREISDWEERDKPVAWLKVSLDQDLLLQSLQRLFENYVDSGPGMDQVEACYRQEIKEGFRPLAAQMEFVRQYQELLNVFQDTLYSLKDAGGKECLSEQQALLYPVRAYKELAVIRLERPETLGLVLDAFRPLLERYFPACLEDCPVRLSVSLGNIKYPYQEHWRFFEERQLPGKVFHLQQPGSCRVMLTVRQFQALRAKLKGKGLSHFLHRMATIEAEAGELTAMVQALERRRDFPGIQELMWQHNLTLGQVLDFYRLVGVAGKEVMTSDR